MAFPGVETLTELIRPLAERNGMDVESVRTVKAGRKSQVVIALDSDTHPTLDELEAVSTEIGELFDAHEDAGEVNFGAGYTLEVTTPGVDLPLTLMRHWRRNRGRRVRVGEDLYRIGALDETAGTVVLVGTGKTPTVHLRTVSELPPAVVEVEFNNPPAAEMELAEKSYDEAASLASDGEEDK
ncbi:ribosome maturation factor RimP [Corynebacterium sp. UBA2622]|uniref:ribosome maturation factor RimP n=1 Tax=Corynebacterium sp. UBA2622 TaxID=1946393 RepID=UPI0025C08B19|nr:ribosome maturation factor RimP [Corynebacterium sp. UBA2622]